jgi:hypothetical protein
MKNIILITFVLFIIPIAAQANELGLVINGKAIHLEGSGFNEKNWGVGFEYDYKPKGDWIPFISASGFKDSNEDMSYYAGGGYKHRIILNRNLDNLHLDLGGFAFLMTRKDYHDNRPFPGILPMASIGTDTLALNITYIPKVDPKLVPIVFLQLVYKMPLDI